MIFFVGPQKAVHFTLTRPQPLLFTDNLSLWIDLPDQLPGDLAYGYLLLGGDIDLLPDGPAAFVNLKESIYRILYIVKVPCGGQGSQLNGFPAGQKLGNIVGMTALADCLGPYVLKGRTMVTGKSKER